MTKFRDAGSQYVSAFMATDLYTVTPDTVVASALRLIPSDQLISHLLVLSEGTLAGIVSRNDLLVAPASALVGELMACPVICIGPETDLDEAVEIMSDNGIGCLPIVVGQHLVGMVTRAGLVSLGVIETDEDTDSLVCVVCGNCQDVRLDPRAACIAICADCLPPLTTAQ